MKYQVRLFLTDAFATAARADARDPILKPVNDVLDKYGLKMVNQLSALVGMLKEAKVNNNTDTDLYRWTMATVSSSNKRKKFRQQFTLYALNDDQVYDQAIAEGARDELKPMEGGAIISRIDYHNSDPAQNPQAPDRYKKSENDAPDNDGPEI